jgi:NAD(P)-dependent dehydrogenase (short-subunit alcohol dehydrogenase family)
MQRIWLITGVSGGLGKALAEEVIKQGDVVVGTFRNAMQAQAFSRSYPHHGQGVVLDIRDPQAISNLFLELESKYQRLDVLVNNAGVGFAGAVEEADEAEWREVMETNFFGTLSMTKAALKWMRKQARGHIVQISSHSGIRASAGFGVYNASKFALEGMSEALYEEVKPLGIHLTLVEPGPFRTNFAGSSLIEAKQHLEAYQATAGVFRQRLRQISGQQEGDPVKAARAIWELVGMENPPLRLPLGKIALESIQLKLDRVRQDMELTREIAERVVFV